MIITRKRVFCLWLILGAWLYPVASMGADSAGSSTAIRTVDPRQTLGAQSSLSQTRDELFLEVFKHPALNIPVSSYVFFVLDGVTQQKIRAVLSQGEQNILLEGKPVMAFLSQQHLRADIMQRLGQRIDAEGWLSRVDLEEAGVSTAFNLRKFEFTVITVPGMREKRVQYLTPPMVDPLKVDAIRPAPVSAFVNFDLKGTVRTETAAFATSHQTHTGFSSNGAINVMGVVVEGSALGQTGIANSLQRGDVRMVYDQAGHALRYTAGDLRYPVIGYQTVVNMGGIGISKDFSLQPHVRTYRTDLYEFYLERAAEVKVWVNESLVSTLQLPAGRHDIRGLTPAVGQNDTRLVIEDVAGRREVLHFSFIFNPILLEKGRKLFSYNAGFRRELKDGAYQYDTKKPVLSASYLQGFTDETTLGVYTQADDSRSLFGVKTIHVLPAGTMQLDMATSRSGSAKQDLAAKLDWIRIPDTRSGPGVQSQLSVEYLGKNFGLINASSPAQKNVLNFQAALAFPLGNGVIARLSGSYNPARAADSVDAHRVAATLTRRWGKYATVSATLRQYRSNKDEAQTELLFGISYNFSEGTSSFSAAKEMETNTVSSRWDSGRPSNSMAAYGFASTRLGSDSREYLAGVGYSGNQGLVEASHVRTQINQNNIRFARDETVLRLQNAIVLANTTFALARQVTDNFAIVQGKDGLAGIDIKVDPDGRGGSRAQSGWLSPAVLVDIANYRLRDLRIEPVNPPLGATPEKMTFSLAPTYKSGFLLKLGKERRIVAIGRLVDDQRQPLAYLPIEIWRLDNRDKKLVSTFTSRGGGFQMPDTKPGRYEIRSSSTKLRASVTVEILVIQDDLYRLGDVVMLPRSENAPIL